MFSVRRFFSHAVAVGALALASLPVLVPTDAAASVSISVPFETLVKDADAVAFVTAGEQKSVWEDGRIYTYTKVKIDQGVAGDTASGADGWVRTMGGVVGKVGQHVDGEPVLVKDKGSLLFLRKFDQAGVFEVSARAQGQYPVVLDEKTKLRKVIRSTAVGLLLPPNEKALQKMLPSPNLPNGTLQTQSVTETAKPIDPKTIRLAQVVLHDRPADDVAREIASEWKRLHPVTTPTK